MNQEYYDLLEECENKLARVSKDTRRLRREVNDTITDVKCMIEVEDFLTNGPGGVDPD
jgi:hypothetical protein